MGLFSWCTSDTKKSIALGMEGYEGCPKKVYLLNPFGEPYVETDYDGYGTFGDNDVYALVAKWNAPELCKDENGNWLPDTEIRDIGIKLTHPNIHHVQLQYPIKIVEHLCDYKDANISPPDPHQGCLSDGVPVEFFIDEIDKAFHSLKEAEESYRILQLCFGHEDVYEKALKDASDTFKEMVVKHPDTPENILLKLVHEDNVYVHQKLVENPKVSNYVLHELEKVTKSDYVYRKIKEHPNYVNEPLDKTIKETRVKQNVNTNVTKRKDEFVK